MIRGKTITLRAPEPSDAPTLHRWANDPDLWRMLGGWHFPYSKGSTQAWIEAHGARDGADQVFCIVAPGDDLVGTANLTDIDWKNRTASHGLMLGEARFRGKGYALDASFALMRFAFDELGLHRLDAEILASNVRSQRFFAKCGWTVEGTRRRWYYKDGRRHDMVLVGILREEYLAKAAELGYAQLAHPRPSDEPPTAARPHGPVVSPRPRP